MVAKLIEGSAASVPPQGDGDRRGQ